MGNFSVWRDKWTQLLIEVFFYLCDNSKKFNPKKCSCLLKECFIYANFPYSLYDLFKVKQCHEDQSVNAIAPWEFKGKIVGVC